MLLARPLVGLTSAYLRSAFSSSPSYRSGLTNILAANSLPTVQVKSLTPAGHIELANGLLLSGACIFLGGKIFLWDVPCSGALWDGWGRERFEIFDIVVPKPGI